MAGTAFLHSSRRAPDLSRLTAAWLWTVAALVLAMVVVGGATRLTDSGLSITEWNLISGALPPMGQDQWHDLFAKYQQIPQFRLVNPDMSLDEFKTIFWWEWAHRLLGRTVGLVFLVPFVALWLTRRIPPRLIGPCLCLLGLGALQGGVGWWMVSSGLSERVSVAPERLAVHLGLALLLLSGLVWTALEAGSRPNLRPVNQGWSRASLGLWGLIMIQSLLGALVAGNDAGLVHNDWPNMGGRFFPADYGAESLWLTLAHSDAAVQFNHRIGAYLVIGLVALCVTRLLRSRLMSDAARSAGVALAAVSLAQVVLGILTLIHVVPVGLGIAHQALAALLLASASLFAWTVRRAVL